MSWSLAPSTLITCIRASMWSDPPNLCPPQGTIGRSAAKVREEGEAEGGVVIEAEGTDCWMASLAQA